ncbi:MAG TPA: signal peptidase I [Myxococcaceae bacterium]|jgi:signal peptidase I
MKKTRLRLFLFLLVGAGALGLVGLVVLRSLVVHTWRIPSSSMYPAFNRGDVVAGLQWPYRSAQAAGEAIRRGEVVIFSHPEENRDYLKRVVGLPGDTVEVQAMGDVLVNGVLLERCLLGPWPDDERQQVQSMTAFLETQADRRYIVLQDLSAPRQPSRTVVPPGQVFVMGDNRDNAWDSRFWGTVPFERLRARASRIVFSGANSAVWKKPRLGHQVDASPLVPASMEAALKRCQDTPIDGAAGYAE